MTTQKEIEENIQHDILNVPKNQQKAYNKFKDCVSNDIFTKTHDFSKKKNDELCRDAFLIKMEVIGGKSLKEIWEDRLDRLDGYTVTRKKSCFGSIRTATKSTWW